MPTQPLYIGETAHLLGVGAPTVIRWGAAGLVDLLPLDAPDEPLAGQDLTDPERHFRVRYDSVLALVHDGGPRSTAGVRALVREAQAWLTPPAQRGPYRGLSDDLKIMDGDRELAVLALREGARLAASHAPAVLALIHAAIEEIDSGTTPDLEPVARSLRREHRPAPPAPRYTPAWMLPRTAHPVS